MYDLPTIVQFLVNGVAIGCVYDLVGIGFSVIFNASGIVNFAQGAFVMLGGVITYVLSGLPLVVAAVLTVVFTGLVGAGFEWLVVRRLYGRYSALFVMILATLALSVITESAVLLMVGDQPMSFPSFTPGAPLRILGVAVDRQILWIVGGSVLLVLLLGALYRYTLIGKAMRACAINSQVASLLAVPAERTRSYSLALSAALGAVGGILITPTQYTIYSIAVPYSVSGFIAAILGGLSNPGGAFVGGVIVGVLQTLAVLFFDAGYKDIVAFSVLLVFLFVRPAGLFGSLVKD